MVGEVSGSLEQRYWELAQTVVEETGYRLYDLEYIKGSKTLRVYIADKKTGTALIDDCVAVDRAFTPYVEEADWIPDDFVLEVSSPGVYRKLKTPEHFREALGERIQVDLFKTLGEQGAQGAQDLPKKIKNAKRAQGVLKESDTDKIILDADGIEVVVEVANIKKANLEPDL